MKIKTSLQFKENTTINLKLVDAVIKQIGGWTSFTDDAPDVVEYGAAGGVSGFIYYGDTVKFAENNRPFIKALLNEIADDCGETFGKLLGGFSCLKISESEAYDAFYDKENENYVNVYNGLALFALEEVCRSYVDLLASE